MNVLLLNADYRPLNTLSNRKAMSLLQRDCVLPASGEAFALRSPSKVFEIPHVLVLRRYVNVPQRGVRWSKTNVFKRDRHTCGYCGVRVGEMRKGRVLARSDFSIDHVVPKARGGQSTWGNTICACRDCNNRKDNRLPHEAGMRLLWEPKRPRVEYLIASGDTPASWKVYLEV